MSAAVVWSAAIAASVLATRASSPPIFSSNIASNCENRRSSVSAFSSCSARCSSGVGSGIRADDLTLLRGVESVRQPAKALVQPGPECDAVSDGPRHDDRAKARDVFGANLALEPAGLNQADLQLLRGLSEPSEHGVVVAGYVRRSFSASPLATTSTRHGH